MTARTSFVPGGSAHTQQDIELDKLFMDVAAYNTRIMGPAHVEAVADLACRTALSYRQPAHITFPADLQDAEWHAGEVVSPV